MHFVFNGTVNGHGMESMGFFNGFAYNFKGLKLGIRTPRLLLLGLIRFFVVILFTVILGGFILVYHQEILNLLWKKPESDWILLLWHGVSWLLSLFLLALSAVVSYLTAQILFAVYIMDLMSRITERKVSGAVKHPGKMPFFTLFIHLVKQEIPRAVLPVFLTLILMVVSWLTPLGPAMTVVSPLAASLFLAWDNTDLVPARRLEPFKQRFNFLLKNLPFHLGFGLWFLIPGINILCLSFAPVGATLYHVEQAAPAEQ